MAPVPAEHARLMDDVYRYQRLFYDLTRKYYLLGRDHLIGELGAQPGATILEVGCGTGRNLAKIARRYPEARLFGLDISEQMLISARKKLRGTATLGQGDACNFDPDGLFGQGQFDHIVLSYSLSMIPDWQGTLDEALRHLAPGGRLHLVDFGDQSRMPQWFESLLLGWLARFHVSPRTDLPAELERRRSRYDAKLECKGLFRSYAVYGHLALPHPATN